MANYPSLLYILSTSHTCAPAAGNSRSRFVHMPSLARTRLNSGVRPRRASVGPSPQELHLRRAIRAPGLHLHPLSHAHAPAVSKSRTRFVHTPSLARTRTCGEQDAHRVCICSRSRTHAVHSGCVPAPGSCWLKPTGTRACGTCGEQGRAPCLHLLPASHAPRTCGEQVAHPVCAHAQPRTHAVKFGCAPAPGSCWPKPAGASPAVSNSRSRFASAPALARTRFIPGAVPAPGSCWPPARRYSHLRGQRACAYGIL